MATRGPGRPGGRRGARGRAGRHRHRRAPVPGRPFGRRVADRRPRIAPVSRPLRRVLLAALNRIGAVHLVEDMRRHRRAWIVAAAPGRVRPPVARRRAGVRRAARHQAQRAPLRPRASAHHHLLRRAQQFRFDAAADQQRGWRPSGEEADDQPDLDNEPKHRTTRPQGLVENKKMH